MKNGVDINLYSNLIAFLKRRFDGFIKKKSKVLSSNDFEKFLRDAPDSQYLATKVALIFGINGACRQKELHNITTNDIENQGKMLLVKIPNTKNKIPRSFIIDGPLLADSGADILTLKRHGGWRSSTVAESYVEDSIQNKANINASNQSPDARKACVDLLKSQALSVFITGLNKDLNLVLKALQPKTLEDAILLAVVEEQQLKSKNEISKFQILNISNTKHCYKCNKPGHTVINCKVRSFTGPNKIFKYCNYCKNEK
ncbi:unnamed protein product [Diatraea saccharalis]|uniref:CCHC-type domain-containing protein n=1 Tax=Diatraea saccharalis TaxID=40085 RepID=A0A9N9R677_9NEOP|nr:unnamed protein product [Diatraea saccharalis]